MSGAQQPGENRRQQLLQVGGTLMSTPSQPVAGTSQRVVEIEKQAPSNRNHGKCWCVLA